MIRWLVGTALLLLGVSALMWFVVLAPQTAARTQVAQPRTLVIDANTLESIEIRRTGAATSPGSSGAATRLLRSGLSGGLPAWLIRETGTATGAASIDWPADSERVRAAIRVLQTTQIIPNDADSAVAGPALATLVIAQRGGDITIEFLDRPLLGRARVRVTELDGTITTGTVESAFFDAIVQTGPAAWGSAFVLQPAASGPGRVSIRRADGELELIRRADRWRITDPYNAPASVDAVAGMLGALGRARVSGDAMGTARTPYTGEGAFPEVPGVVITLSADRPATGETWTQRVEIGDLASLGGESILVRVTGTLGSRTLWGSRVLEVPAQTFDAINPRPDAYLSLTPSDLATAGVGGFRLLPPGLGLDAIPTNKGAGAREFRLYGADWVAMYGDARSPVPGTDAEAIVGVIRAVTSGVATRIETSPDRGVSSTEGVRLVLLDPLYQPAQVFTLSVEPGLVGVAAGGLRWILSATAEADLAHITWLDRTIAATRTAEGDEAESMAPSTPESVAGDQDTLEQAGVDDGPLDAAPPELEVPPMDGAVP